MNGPLENTVSGNRRLKNIHSRLYVKKISKCSNQFFGNFFFFRETPINFGEMQKQSWSLTSENYIVADDDNDDDDNDVQLGNNTFYKLDAKIQEEDEEEEQQTLKTDTYKTARQTMIERKLHEADVRAQTFK